MGGVLVCSSFWGNVNALLVQISFLRLGSLLLDLFLALDHDHGQECKDNGQTKDQKDARDPDGVFAWGKVSVQEVCLVHERL